MKTARMVRLDWHRTFGPSAAIGCLRSELAKEVATELGPKAAIETFRRLSLQRFAAYEIGFRYLLTDKSAPPPRPTAATATVLEFGRGRTELQLIDLASGSSDNTADLVRIAKQMLKRTPRS